VRDLDAAAFRHEAERLVSDLDAAALRYEAARRELQEATVEAKAAAVDAVAAGVVSEVEAARRLGVTRMTLRKWIGKG